MLRKIAMDLRPLQSSHARRGIGRWLLEFVLAVASIDTTTEYMILWSGFETVPQFFKNQSVVRIPQKIPGIRWLTDYLLLPLYVQQTHADLYVATDYMAYPLNRSSIPVVSIIYDFLPLSLPEYKWRTRWGCRLNFNHLSSHQHLFFISDYTLSQVGHYLKEPMPLMSKIGVGVNHHRFHPSSREDIEAVSQKWNLSRYVIYVGETNRRKNILRLIQAVDGLPEDIALVLVGGSFLKAQDLVQAVKQIKYPRRVRLTGHLEDPEMVALISGAEVMVFPSLAEGFGFPVIEAMACGTPVITSITSSLPEAANGAALLVNPVSVESIQQGIQQLLDSPQQRERLRSKGFQHTSQLTWEHCAKHFLDYCNQQ